MTSVEITQQVPTLQSHDYLPDPDEFDQGNRFPVLSKMLKQDKTALAYTLCDFASVQVLFIGEHQAADSITALAQDLAKLGLVTEYNQEGRTFYYAKQQTAIDSLHTHEAGNMNDDDWGGNYGYPETAIQAFVHGGGIARTDLPDYIKQAPFLPYAHFAFSKEHYEEEWDEFLHKIKTFQTTYPDVYQALKFPDMPPAE